MLTREDFKSVLSIIGEENIELEVLRAVTQVEAPNGGFDAKGRLTILFEAHIFYRELQKKGINPSKFIPAYADVLSKNWNPKLYGKYSAQWGRLDKAATIDKEAAYRSASYGAFQILGYHAESLGYKNVFEFVESQKSGERSQLKDFVTFLKVNNLLLPLKMKDWANFARGYNGPAYKVNEYDKKLAQAYKKLKNETKA